MITLGSLFAIIVFMGLIVVLGMYRDKLKGIFIELSINATLSLLITMGLANFIGMATSLYLPVFVIGTIGITIIHMGVAPTPQSKMRGVR